MRYLFGDSTPFPLGYNFLTTLEAFMTASTRIVQLDLEGALLARQRDDRAQNRIKGLDALEQFHNVVMRAVQDTAQKVHHQHALEYARAVAEYATRYIDDHRRVTLAANERESGQLRGDADRRTVEMRAQLEAFLKTAIIPVLKTKLAIRLNLDGKDTRHSGMAAFDHPDGIATAFTIAPHRTPSWSSPRKVSDFVQGVSLRVGVEKSWLRGTVTAKELNVDDWIIAQVDMSDEVFDLVLRKKLHEEKEKLLFQLRRSETGAIVGTVEHPGAPDAETLPKSLATQDVVQLERIWNALTLTVRELSEQKEQLLNVSLDAQPVFDGGLVVPFIARLIAMFAPTVREIAKRSPNEFELTLKVESDGGRREELYLRKVALVSTLQPLPSKGREIFAPLGLDTWVPSATVSPPPALMAPESSTRDVSDVPPAVSSKPPPPPPPPPPTSSSRKV